MQNLVGNISVPSAEDEYIRQETLEIIDEGLEELSPRAAGVLRAKYGLDAAAPRTFREIGQDLNVSGERARQIHGKAIRRLRYPSVARRLKSLSGNYDGSRIYDVTCFIRARRRFLDSGG
jgi:RNA polymerase primary sigma factor